MATTTEWSQALDSGSREPGSILASALLVGFIRKNKYTMYYLLCMGWDPAQRRYAGALLLETERSLSDSFEQACMSDIITHPSRDHA